MVLVVGSDEKGVNTGFAEWFVIDPIFGHEDSVMAIVLDVPRTILVMWMA
jgi:hypothetical protein